MAFNISAHLNVNTSWYGLSKCIPYLMDTENDVVEKESFTHQTYLR